MLGWDLLAVAAAAASAGLGAHRAVIVLGRAHAEAAYDPIEIAGDDRATDDVVPLRDTCVEDELRVQAAAIAGRYERLRNALPGVVYETDPTGSVVFVSKHWETLTGRPEKAAYGLGWTRNIHPDDREWVLADALHSITTGAPFERVYRIMHTDGTIHWIMNRATRISDSTGTVLGVVGVLIDQTETIEAHRTAAEFATVINASTDFVVIFEPDGTITQLSDAARDVLRLNVGDRGGIATVLDSESRGRYTSNILPRIVAEGAWRGELTFELDTYQIPVSATLIGHPNHDGTLKHISISARDITDLRAAQARLSNLADHDQLTGLPNRRRLARDLADRISTHPLQTAVLFIDLDGFKSVNDTLGHDAGDELLMAVAAKLGELVRPGDIVSRVGGDEFVVVIHATTPRDSAAITQRLIDELAEPFLLSAGAATISASIGVHHVNDHDNATTVLTAADLAMYEAKHQGKSAYRYSR